MGNLSLAWLKMDLLCTKSCNTWKISISWTLTDKLHILINFFRNNWSMISVLMTISYMCVFNHNCLEVIILSAGCQEHSRIKLYCNSFLSIFWTAVSCSTFFILFAAAVYSARQSNEAEIKRLKVSFYCWWKWHFGIRAFVVALY